MAVHAPITGAPARAPFSRTDRLAIETQIEHLIALLDVADGDPDIEDGDSDCCNAGDDASSNWTPRASGPVWLGHHEDDEDDDPAGGVNAEDDFDLPVMDSAPGCPLSDPGGTEADPNG